MNLTDLLNSITPEIHQNLKRSVEIGKWPNGEALTSEQRQLCMQAVIAFEEKHVKPEERSGYIPPKKHVHCGSKTGNIADDDEQPLTFQ